MLGKRDFQCILLNNFVQDIKLIMPTVLILLFKLFVILTFIPYAFQSVIKQLQAVWAVEEQRMAVYNMYFSCPNHACCS